MNRSPGGVYLVLLICLIVKMSLHLRDNNNLCAADILKLLIENGDASDLENLSDNENDCCNEPNISAQYNNHVEMNFGDEDVETTVGEVSHELELDQEEENTKNLVPGGSNYTDVTTSKADIHWKKDMFTTREPPELTESSSDYNSLPSPIHLFQKYVPKSVLVKACDFTNMYALQNDKTNFKECSVTEIETVFALHIAMGSLKLPRVELYWNPSVNIGLFMDSKMSRKRFFQIRNNLHFVNNLEKPDDMKDVFFKVRLLYDSILSRCRELDVEQYVSVDEQMIPFTGKLSVKQYVKGKPCPWGVKNFVLCGKSGMACDFLLYQGKLTVVKEAPLKDFGLGAAVVLKLSERLGEGHCLFFDNYFSSYPLLQILKSKMIFAACTARTNRFSSPPLTDDKALIKTKNRGYSEEVVSEDGDVVMTKWVDNRTVTFASNYVGIGDKDTVRRWNAKNKAYMNIERPEVIKHYNSGMGGVDLFDRFIALYRITVRSRKWTLRLIFHAIDIAVTNSWLEYKRIAEILKVPKKDQLDLLYFRLQLSEEIIKVGKSNASTKRGRPSLESLQELHNLPPRKRTEQRPTHTVQLDTVGHIAVHDRCPEPTRCKNEQCGKFRSHIYCSKCKVHLCINQKRNCFADFHKQ